MKRDMDLARTILFAVEKDESNSQSRIKLNIPGKPSQEVSYYVEILAEAGLITAISAGPTAGSYYFPKRLTWEGHEFLDAARNDTLWEQAKTETLKQTGGLSIDLLKAVLLDLAKKALSL